jgi:DNA-binding IclR family transcriptional regulator
LLERLVVDWQETAVLCAYNPVERKSIIADVVLTPHPLRFAVEPGVEISLPWGSLGRAVLAFLPPGEIEAIIRESRIGPLTGRPRSPRPEIDKDLAAIRAQRCSRYFDPTIDIAGVSAPIFGLENEILGCLGVTMPSKRYHLHREDDLLLSVRAAADVVSEQAAISHS